MQPVQSSPARVLIVDDEWDIRRALTRALQLSGFKATAASSGDEALARLAAVPYDVMLLDLRMPGMQGEEVMQRAHKYWPELLIIILTGHATMESAIMAVRSDAVDYLIKPISVHEVIASVTRTLEGETERRQRRQVVETIRQAIETLYEPETRPSAPAPALPLPCEAPLTHVCPSGRCKRVPPSGRAATKTGDYRRGLPLPEGTLYVHPLTLDCQRRLLVVEVDGEPHETELSEGEALILGRLMVQPGQVFSCQQLARQAWRQEVDEATAQSIVRPIIARLRGKVVKLCSPGSPVIQNLRGRGYFLGDVMVGRGG